MFIDHIHFYVENAAKTRDWLMDKMGFQYLKQLKNHHTQTEIVTNNYAIFFVISSPLNSLSPVYNYLNLHASGVVDVAFRVNNLDSLIKQNNNENLNIIHQITTHNLLDQGIIKYARIKGWNSLNHTLIENNTNIPFCFLASELVSKIKLNLSESQINLSSKKQLFSNFNNLHKIDHVVLNVSSGELAKAVTFYQNLFKFKIFQTFNINTNYSGLASQALISPQENFYFNINEPTSANSQIQEFIDCNRGSGIQHIALKSTNIIDTVTQMRHNNLSFLPISENYYDSLKRKIKNQLIPGLKEQEWKAIKKHKILVDWEQNSPESLLMQIFTKPIFNEPTFFFELIERRKQAQGFGQMNFQNLFELIEKEQKL